MMRIKSFFFHSLFGFLVFTVVYGCSGSSVAPSITLFELTSDRFTALNTATFNLETENDANVTGWLITESDIKPAGDSENWEDEKPTSYIMSSSTYGSKRLYAWVKTDSAVSDSAHFSITHVAAGTEDTTMWDKYFDGNDGGEDIANGVALDSLGNIYVVGHGTNLETDSSGKTGG